MDEEQKILFPEEKQKILSHEEKQELLEIYRITEKRRMHYDTLGWAIGAVLVPLAIYAYRFALVELRAKTEYIVPVGVIGIVLFLFWHMCYDRLGKFALLAIESINKIENILQLSVKPQHHFHKTIFTIGGLVDFKGFGDYFSFWSLRWIFFSIYSFTWMIIWMIKLKGMEFGLWALLYIVVPVFILFYLNFLSLAKKAYLNLNPRFVSVLFTLLWFAAGLAFFSTDALRSVPSFFGLFLTP